MNDSQLAVRISERGKRRMERNEEQRLIRRAMGGDLGAFNTLVLANQDRIYNHARWMLGAPQEAEDVAQETFLRAFHQLSRFRGGSFQGWLMRIATNLCYDELRRPQRSRELPLQPVDSDGEETELPAWLTDPDADVERAVEAAELGALVQRCIAGLPPEYRGALLLVDVDDYDYRQAAEILNVPMGTVKSRLARARRMVREGLWKQGVFFDGARDRATATAF